MNVRQEVYDTYWKLAAERQEIFFKKFYGADPPYTSDPILATYKFCNVYRASDRVSQFLIRNVIYKNGISAENTLFRIFLFRLLNKIETWKNLEEKLGGVYLKNFNTEKYSNALNEILRNGKTIYGNAFILCATKAFGFEKKHDNHLALLQKVFVRDRTVETLIKAPSLKSLFLELRELPLVGNFMAYQLAIDFNYSEVFNFSENDFTIAGPGAIRGIRKCFSNTKGKSSEHIISHMVESQDTEFNRLGIQFKNLWGRPMHAIDCQGMFCELDKYSRVRFPDLKSNRVRIKAKYKTTPEGIEYFYPPKWGINQKMMLQS